MGKNRNSINSGYLENMKIHSYTIDNNSSCNKHLEMKGKLQSSEKKYKYWRIFVMGAWNHSLINFITLKLRTSIYQRTS